MRVNYYSNLLYSLRKSLGSWQWEVEVIRLWMPVNFVDVCKLLYVFVSLVGQKDGDGMEGVSVSD